MKNHISIAQQPKTSEFITQWVTHPKCASAKI